MTVWIAILLGIIQGLTEFLPVSSSGHLVLLEQIFGIENNVILFDVILHCGTLLAVCFVYYKSIWNIIKNPLSKESKQLLIATIPTFIIALIFKSFFEKSFDGSLLVFGFITTAIFLIIAEVISKKYYQYKELDYTKAGIIGVFQGLAILPGVSRSGATITSAIVQGVRREKATEFSFLMSIPVILASLLYELIKTGKESLVIPFSNFVVGFIFSAIFGYFAIKLMIKVVKKAKFYYFSIYLILLSAFLILNKFVLFWW